MPITPRRPSLLGLAVALFGSGAACDQPDQPPVRGGPARAHRLARRSAPPARPSDRVLRARAKDLLRGPRSRGRVGDWIVRNEHLVAVFRARDGRLVDLGLRGEGRDHLHKADPYVFHTADRYRVRYRSARVVRVDGPARHALELTGEARGSDLDVAVRTRVWAPPGAWYLTFETTVRNRDARRVLSLGIADAVFPGNTRWFVPGLGRVRRSVKAVAQWLGREEAGHVFALVSGERRPALLLLRLSEEAFNPTAGIGWKRAHLAPDATLRVRRHLVFRKGSLAEASADIQRLLGGATRQVRLTAADSLPPGSAPWVELWRAGAPILSSRFHKPLTATVAAGAPVRARLVLPGAGPGPFVAVPPDPAAPPVPLRLPAYGQLRYRVTGADGAPLPARLRFRGVGDTPAPDFGDDGTVQGAVDCVYSGSGRGTRLLRPGTYEVWVTRGLEYGVVRARVTVRPGQVTALHARLDRQIDTGGALAADLHLHANPSMDSDVSLRARVIQLAAVGVEYAVATDHNAVTDYSVVLRTAGLARWLVSDVGLEVTPRRASWGHFNVWPLPPGSSPLPYFDILPSASFAAWRRLPTHPVIQVNHPRMGTMGYLNQVDWIRRRGRAFGPGFSRNFDALEVFNGDYVYRPDRVERNLGDWFTLLNVGATFTATGNSDAHKLGYQEAGYPRNFVLVAPKKDTPAALRTPAGHADRALHDALKHRRNVVSSGPYPTLSVTGPHGTPRLVVGRTLEGRARVTLTVQAACWVPVSEVALVENGRTVQKWTLPRPYGHAGTDAVRPALPAAPGKPLTAPGCNPVRFQKVLELAPKADTWYVLIARSRLPLPVLRHRATAVYGFTNPVRIDADGDGRFHAPGLGVLPPTR